MDFNSSLPIKTLNAGDVIAKIADATIPSQQLAISAAGEASVTAASLPLPTGASTEAKQDAGNASLASIDTKLTGPLPVTGPLTDTELRASPVDVLGPLTDAELRATPVPVVGTLMVTPAVSDLVSYNVTDLAAGASAPVDFTPSAGARVAFTKVLASASGKLKIEVQTETGLGTGVFNTYAVQFSSSASPNIDIDFAGSVILSMAPGAIVRYVLTNEDVATMSVYTTLVGRIV